jgi:phenol/toluene 2-monooxygenase (NADH) P5/A5
MTRYTITVEPLGSQVTCRGDQTVLDACLREGIWLPHACTHGTCGTCKAQVLDGDIDHGDASPYALLDTERDEGSALICVAMPRGDLVIEGEVEAEEGVAIHPVRDYTGVVHSVEEPARSVRKLVIDLDHPLAFNPGQYVQLHLPAGGTRPYSMASGPADGQRIELHVKRSPGGAATDGWIFRDLAPGATIDLSGPYGRFSFRPARTEPVLLLACGTGLAPIKSMLTHLAATGDGSRQAVLYHGVTDADALYEHDWLQQFERDHPWFAYRPALSRGQWQGRTGRVPDLLAEDYPRAAGHVAYICGSPGFVTDTMKALMKARLFPRDMYREDFFDSADRAAGTHIVRGPLIRR